MGKREALVIVGCCTIHLTIGSLYLWGTISTYLNSFFRKHNNPDLRFTLVNSVFLVTSFLIAAFSRVGLKLMELYGQRLPTLLLGLTHSVFVFASSFCTDFYAFFFLYGVGQGMCVGSLYLVAVVLGVSQYPSRKGLISGIIISCFALSSVIVALWLVPLINPENVSAVHHRQEDYYYYPDSVTDNLPFALRVLSAYFLGLTLLSNSLLLVLRQTPLDQSTLSADSLQESLQESPAENIAVSALETPRDFKTLRQYETYVLGFIYMTSMIFPSFINVNYKSYGLDRIHDDRFLSIVVGNLALLSNACSRPLWGFLMDRVSFRSIFFVVGLTNLALELSIDYISTYKSLFCIWVSLAYAIEGAHFVILPIKCLQLYGVVNGGVAFSFVNLFGSLASLTQLFLYGMLINRCTYKEIFYVHAAFTCIALILNYIFKMENNGYRLRVKQKRKLEAIV